MQTTNKNKTMRSTQKYFQTKNNNQNAGAEQHLSVYTSTICQHGILASSLLRTVERYSKVYNTTAVTRPWEGSLSVLMGPDFLPSAIQPMDSISRTPILGGCKMLHCHEAIQYIVELQTDYVFNPYRRLTVMASLGFSKLYSDYTPAASVSELYKVEVINYLYRKRKLSKAFRRAEYTYIVPFTVKVDGSLPVTIDLSKADITPIVLFIWELVTSVRDFAMRFDSRDPLSIEGKVFKSMMTTVNTVRRMAWCLISTLGKEELIFDPDHKASLIRAMLFEPLAMDETGKSWALMVPLLDMVIRNTLNVHAALDIHNESDEESPAEPTVLEPKNQSPTRPYDTSFKQSTTKKYEHHRSPANRFAAFVSRVPLKMTDYYAYQTRSIVRIPHTWPKLVGAVDIMAWVFPIFSRIFNIPADVLYAGNRQQILLSLGGVVEHGYSEAKSLATNQMVHALNGNIFPQTMSDVDAAPSFSSMTRATEPVQPTMPITRNSHIHSAFNHSTEYSGIVCDAMEETGLRRAVAANYPFSGLQLIHAPMSMEAVGGHIDVKVYPRLGGGCILNVGLTDYWDNSLTPTYGTNVYSGNYMTDCGGFNPDDIKAVNGHLPYGGFSFERPIYTLLLLHSAIKHSDINNIPPSCFTNASDFIKYGPKEQLSFHWNLADVHADCPTPASNSVTVFPFGGEGGKICFHNRLQTVAFNRVPHVYMIPNSLLNSFGDSARTLSVFVMSIAKYPFFTAGYKANEPTYPEDMKSAPPSWHTPPGKGEANADWWISYINISNRPSCAWMLNHSTVNLPGPVNIDILLPRGFKAKTGPTSLTRSGIVYHANAQLKGDPQSTSLCDYMNSWLPTMSALHIALYIECLHSSFGIDKITNACWDLMVSSVQRAPPLLNNQVDPPKQWGTRDNKLALVKNTTSCQTSISDSDIPNTSSDNTNPLVQYCDILHTKASELYTPNMLACRRARFADQQNSHQLENNIILTPYREVDGNSSFVLNDLNNRAWNYVILGLATAPNFEVGEKFSLKKCFSDNMSIHSEIIRAIQICVPVQLLTQNIGAGASFYEVPKVLSDPTSFMWKRRDTILSLFFDSRPAKAMEALGRIHGVVFGTKVASVGYCDSVSIYGRWLLSRLPNVFMDYRPQIDAGCCQQDLCMVPSPLFIPALLSDIWVQILAKTLPKCAMAFPATYGREGTAGYHEGLEPVYFDNGYHTPRINRDLMFASSTTEHLPQMSDEAKWNVRLLACRNTDTMSWRFLCGDIPEGSFKIGRLPTQVKTAPGKSSTFDERWVYTQSSTCLPFLWQTGAHIFPVDSAQRMTVLGRAEYRFSFLTLPTWSVGNPSLSIFPCDTEENFGDEYSQFLN